MGFDKKKFLQTKFTRREENVLVPDLKDFFLTDEEIENLNKINTQITATAEAVERDLLMVKKNKLLQKAVWKVRGLEGVEMARANEAMGRNKNIAAILEGLIANNAREKIDSVKKLIGIDEKVPNEIAKRIELLIIGSVDPPVDTELAVKICKNYPIEFYQITNTITQLTGLGHVPGKQKASGGTQKSN